eukprot:1140236-Pelagomonas_calceolata.AAC.2
MATQITVLLLGGLKLVLGLGVFTVFDLHKMDVPLFWKKLNRVTIPRIPGDLDWTEKEQGQLCLRLGSCSCLPIPGITACLALQMRSLLTSLTNHFALGISLAKPRSQIPGMLRKSNFLAGPELGIVICKFIFWDGPKLLAKLRVYSEEFGVGVGYH